MWAFKQFLVIVLCALLCVPVALAQEPQRDANGRAIASQDVIIIIQQQQVRFVAQKAGEELHLQVFDQSGALVFDSGAVEATEVNWPLQASTGSGETLKSGLYAYTLSMKEAGATEARLRRGHFIVDRAKDRDGADKLWVTSQNESGVGTELTVAKDEVTTVAGAAISNGSNERTIGQRAEIADRDTSGRTIEEETQGKAKTEKSAVAAPAATIGQIAKFITATTVGDSLISESGGVVQLPAFVSLATTPQGNNVSFGTPNTETGMTISGATGRADVRFDGTTLRLLAGPAGGPPSNGIGITSSNVQLPNNVSLIAGAQGNNVSFGSPNSETGMTISGTSGRADLRFNGTLKLLNGPGGIPPPTNGIAITTAGNVGIGTVTPATKLHVESSGFAELAIRSTNERAILSLNNGLNPQGYIWTLESGVGGAFPSLFGIYNRNVNKPGLTIDGNLLVSVKALQITGGADFAESFDVGAEKLAGGATVTEIQPGMVVTIDPSQPGKLQLSRRAYDRRVAGVISGAGGVKPGMTMGQEQTLADGKYPVALSGRVYVCVDATRSAIHPGDLLTTSSTPGHAMKAGSPAKAQGAIIGKAMTGLKAGKGLVLVLVTLQ